MAPARKLRRVRSRAAAMMAPLEKPMAIGSLMRPWLATVAWTKSANTGMRVVMFTLVYCPVTRPVEERKSAVDGSGSLNTEDRRSWRQFLGQWHEIMLVAARAMQQDQRCSGWLGA